MERLISFINISEQPNNPIRNILIFEEKIAHSKYATLNVE